MRPILIYGWGYTPIVLRLILGGFLAPSAARQSRYFMVRLSFASRQHIHSDHSPNLNMPEMARRSKNGKRRDSPMKKRWHSLSKTCYCYRLHPKPRKCWMLSSRSRRDGPRPFSSRSAHRRGQPCPGYHPGTSAPVIFLSEALSGSGHGLAEYSSNQSFVISAALGEK
jgi:hypothetical protein